jgi:hypothetical protein
VILATLLLALAAPAASAQVAVEFDVEPLEVRYGDATEVTGTVTEDGVPAPGLEVILEGRRYPFDADLRTLETTTTDAEGAFAFEREFDRNWEVRARVGLLAARRVRFSVFPDFTLRFRARSRHVIRLTQTYRVPRGVRLERPTLFYVGRRSARRAPVRAKAEVERTGPGRFRSAAVVRLPTAWNGRFRYASCFRHTFGSGMGDPRADCPRRFRFEDAGRAAASAAWAAGRANGGH